MLMPRSSAATTIHPTIVFFTPASCPTARQGVCPRRTGVIAMSYGRHPNAMRIPLHTTAVNVGSQEVVIAAVSSYGEIHVHGKVCRMGVRGPARGGTAGLSRGGLRTAAESSQAGVTGGAQ